eukprot:6483236-Amphidinium_carterae.2
MLQQIAAVEAAAVVALVTYKAACCQPPDAALNSICQVIREKLQWLQHKYTCNGCIFQRDLLNAL